MSPWVESGYDAVALRSDGAVQAAGVNAKIVDISDPVKVSAELQLIGDLAFVLAIPPCADLCAAGARWWKRKRERNANFQNEAAKSILELKRTLLDSQAPFCMILPASRVIRRLVGRPDLSFDPHEFGGYLSHNSAHPLFPDVVPPQDRYTKRSFAFVGNGAILPIKKSVPPTFTLIQLKNGKIKRVSPVLASRKNKQTRSLAPLGFCRALSLLNRS